MFLIKAATSEVWWPEDADHVAFIRGRLGFDLPYWFIPKDEKQKPTGAFFAGAVVVFDKTWRGPPMSYISRNDLELRGDAFLSQIRREAMRLLPQMQQQNIQENIPAVDEVQEVQEVQPAPQNPAVPAEDKLPLRQEEILSQSGVETWACVRAAFGDKEEYTFKESKFAHVWAADSVSNPTAVTVQWGDIAVAETLIASQNGEAA